MPIARKALWVLEMPENKQEIPLFCGDCILVGRQTIYNNNLVN